MICRSCKQQKLRSDFYSSNRSRCKSCLYQYALKWRTKNKKHYLEHRAEYGRIWRARNREKTRSYFKQWYNEVGKYRRGQYARS